MQPIIIMSSFARALAELREQRRANQRPNPWLKFLDNFRARRGQDYVMRPNQLVKDAAVEWRTMSFMQRRAFAYRN